MRIGLNITYWVPNAMGGSQTYQRQLIAALAAAGGEAEYTVFLNASGAKSFTRPSARFRTRVCRLPGSQRLLRVLWEQAILPMRLRTQGIDVLHSLGYLSPIAAPGATVTTVLDMVQYVHPEDIEPAKRLLWRILFPLSLRRATAIIVISESVKRELARFFPWAAAKATVVPLAVDPVRFSPGPAGPCAAARGRPFLLAVSTISPHKNPVRLVEAFARVRRERPGLDLELVLAGLMRQEQGALLRRTARSLGVSEHVIFAGRVPDGELIQLYRSAEMLVFPSLYEGFGLPVLEAMSCGCPVVSSNLTSLPEVTGDAALLFNPKDVAEMAGRIAEVLDSRSTRERLIARGLERARLFSWQSIAERTMAVYRQCLGRPAGEDAC
jgi:glycosyltransferase involved in cell wall biosynthesis